MSDAESLLKTWQERLAAITRNASELSEAEFTKRIRNRQREGRYAGVTRSRAQAALDHLSHLVDDFLLLAQVIDEAQEAARIGFLGSRDVRDAKVRALLEGPSIQPPSVAVPLQRRELLGASSASQAMTPEALLGAMQDAFRDARDALMDIDAAEAVDATEIAALLAEHAALARRAQASGRSGADDEQPAWTEPDEASADPLGRRDELAACRLTLAAWAGRLSRAEQAQSLACETLALARASLIELDAAAATRTHRAALLRERLGEPDAAVSSSFPTPDAEGAETRAMLATWCDAIAARLDAHDWGAVDVGTRRFRLAVDGALARERDALTALDARRAEIDDLEGLFHALKAKARVLRDRGALPDACVQARSRIDAGLAARPLVLDELHAALRHYQDLLLAAGRS